MFGCGAFVTDTSLPTVFASRKKVDIRKYLHTDYVLSPQESVEAAGKSLLHALKDALNVVREVQEIAEGTKELVQTHENSLQYQPIVEELVDVNAQDHDPVINSRVRQKNRIHCRNSSFIAYCSA